MSRPAPTLASAAAALAELAHGPRPSWASPEAWTATTTAAAALLRDLRAEVAAVGPAHAAAALGVDRRTLTRWRAAAWWPPPDPPTP